MFPSQELINMMLLVNVDQRFSAVQVLEHPWVNVSELLSCIPCQHSFKNISADVLIVLPLS